MNYSPEEHLQRASPIINGTKGHFHSTREIGQGDTPSTLIFAAVFDVLLTMLDDAGVGEPHAYADDDLDHIAKKRRNMNNSNILIWLLLHFVS